MQRQQGRKVVVQCYPNSVHEALALHSELTHLVNYHDFAITDAVENSRNADPVDFTRVDSEAENPVSGVDPVKSSGSKVKLLDTCKLSDRFRWIAMVMRYWSKLSRKAVLATRGIDLVFSEKSAAQEAKQQLSARRYLNQIKCIHFDCNCPKVCLDQDSE